MPHRDYTKIVDQISCFESYLRTLFLLLILLNFVDWDIRRSGDKSLVFPISYFSICSTIKRIFLGWVK
jgi:hypothetical protein